MQHLRDYQSEKEEYYWHTAVIFIGEELDKALIRYLEHRLVEIAKASNRYDILTKNTYKNTVMQEEKVANMERFLKNIKIVINPLGYRVLEPYAKAPAGADTNKMAEPVVNTQAEAGYLYIKNSSADAQGIATNEGFVVLKGSRISSKPVSDKISATIRQMRAEYIEQARIKDYILQEDILCTSPSAAAQMVLGYSVSGQII